MVSSKTKLFSLVTGLLLMMTPFAYAAADTTPPDDLDKAPRVVEVGDGTVKLSWDVGTDNSGEVVAYNVYYGTVSLLKDEKADYTDVVKVDKKTETEVPNLKNGTTYYFAMTALDAAGNESEYYSPETSATPAPKTTSEVTGTVNTTPTTTTTTTTKPVDTTKTTTPPAKDVTKPTDTTKTTTPTKTTSGSTLLTGTGSGLPETIPTLADVTNLAASVQGVAKNFIVTLTWELPNPVNVVKQLVYQSLNGVNFSKLTELTPEVRRYDVRNLTAGKYWFKVTTKNAQGVESKGILKVVELPSSGPEAVALILAGSTMLGFAFRRRK